MKTVSSFTHNETDKLKHIRGVSNLVDKINNIQNKQECQTME